MTEGEDDPGVPWLPSRVILIDRSQPLVDRWREQFADCPAVEVLAGDYFQRPMSAAIRPVRVAGS